MKLTNAIKNKASEAKETLVEMGYVSAELCWFAIKFAAAALATASIVWCLLQVLSFILGVPVAN